MYPVPLAIGVDWNIFAPAVGGNQYQTIWFYERARGQHTQEQMKLTKAERSKYLLKNPKNQVIKKVDLAKYINTYEEYETFYEEYEDSIEDLEEELKDIHKFEGAVLCLKN